LKNNPSEDSVRNVVALFQDYSDAEENSKEILSLYHSYKVMTNNISEFDLSDLDELIDSIDKLGEQTLFDVFDDLNIKRAEFLHESISKPDDAPAMQNRPSSRF